ncbi:hypothetical protein CBM2605_A60270 [Cupriavidus neocaledonicus]|uniref:Transposase n=1 Tax=Cupriavidus neocaledonicus TaxID=1040979 RepID=A0ABY1V2R9_9BURK|nr:hypothetical protein CBM2605_A60270 [Cupriavidus neocaledonicus]
MAEGWGGQAPKRCLNGSINRLLLVRLCLDV